MLISKETTLQVFDNIPTINGLGLEPVIALRDVKEIIKAVPEVDAAPVVHGKWEQEDNIFDDQTFICTVCHEPWVIIDGTPEDNNMHFCPNCGAKMDLEEQNEG